MELFDFLNKIPTLNEITGSLGEWLANMYSKTFPGALVLHDVLIDGTNGYTSQIDLILVGNKGVYVVEVKTFPEAKIYGDTKHSKWYYYNHGKKHEIYSPLRQNKKHVEYLKTFLKDFGDVPIFSIITMICDDFKISGETDGSTAICSSLPAMKKGIYKIADNKPDVFDDSRKKEIFDYIKNKQYSDREARAEHKQNVIAYQESLENMQKQNICPYCKSELVLRNGKNGKFYGCKNFPKCRYTMKYEEQQKETLVE
ncbi:MAG: hypothetical protein E7614_05590 [Ruminococcaceae bacterium]|nr:hypothetical protein [Oscillospiraceae bacterium]